MKRYHLRHALALAACVAVLSILAPARAITVGQVDDFEDGTLMDWHGNQTFNVADIGPNGVGDNVLWIDSNVRMIAVSDKTLDPLAPILPTKWTGNYTAAGVTAISMDVSNPNFYPLNLFLGISANQTLISLGRGATYITDYSFVIPADDQWYNVTFPVTASDFVPSETNTEATPVGAAAILQNVRQLRIFHSTVPGEFRGDEVAGHFLLDNITAEGASVAEDADFDGDDDVDGQDFLIWQRGVGVGTTQPAGDANFNGSVNGQDLAVWKSQFGPAATPVAAAVPEPAAALLGAIAAIGLTRLRRR
jgi:hypothetical protein